MARTCFKCVLQLPIISTNHYAKIRIIIIEAMKRLMIVVSTGDSHTPATCPWKPTVIIQLSPVCLLPRCNSPIQYHRLHMPSKTRLPCAPRWILLKPNGRWTSDGKPPRFEANLRNRELVRTRQSGTCLLGYLWKTMLDSYKPNSKRSNYDLGLTTHYQLQDLNEEKEKQRH